MTTTYAGWWQVPAHLLPATALAQLEYPRTPDGCQPVAWVDTRDWRDRKASIPLYDVRTCPPTKATARQLEAAAGRTGARRICADCDARCQRPLTVDPGDRRPRCPACRQVARLRARQAQLAQARPHLAARAAQLLGWAEAAVVQVDLHTPPPTPAGRRRPATAAHVGAVDLAGRRLVAVLVRLVGRRAHHVPQGAVPADQAAPLVHRALLGRRLICWSHQDLTGLQLAAPHPELPRPLRFPEASDASQPHLPIPEHARAVVVEPLATRWRGQLDPHTRALVPSLAPGTPDRLLLMLRRIAASSDQPATGGGAAPSALSREDA
jgi:hypothetical protein